MIHHKLFASCLMLIIFCATMHCQVSSPQLETVKQWNVLSYDFPWDWPVNDRTLNIPEQIVMTGFEVGRKRIFVSTPRLFSGVPATVSVVSKDSFGDSSVLQAFPDWSHHAAGLKAYNCSDIGLVSVYRMKIDSCNRLWALDSGVSRSLEDFEVTCPPKILVYDLNTDQVVRRIDFPPEVVRAETLFTNLVVDETTSIDKQNCDDVFVYITDTVMPAIVVYDSARDLTWRLTHPAMYPDPAFSDQNILEDKFSLMDGIVGIALDEETRTVYFQPFATDRMFSVAIDALRSGPVPTGKELPVRLVGKKSSQGIGLAVSPKGGSIFFSPFSEIAVAKWNPHSNSQEVLAFDQEKLQFAADIRTTDNDPGALWVLSSRFHRFFLKNLNQNEVNTRILRIPGVVEPRPQTAFLNQGSLSSHNGFLGQYYPTSSKFESFSSLYSPYRQTTRRPSSYQYIKHATQPYNYEPVAVVNKIINNPFLTLQMGEKPLLGQPRPQFGLTGEVYYPKPAISFSDFNGLRVAKSVSSNATSLHN